jgi:hypothetical protein
LPTPPCLMPPIIQKTTVTINNKPASVTTVL